MMGPSLVFRPVAGEAGLEQSLTALGGPMLELRSFNLAARFRSYEGYEDAGCRPRNPLFGLAHAANRLCNRRNDWWEESKEWQNRCGTDSGVSFY